MNANARARWRNHEYKARETAITDYWRTRIVEEVQKLQELMTDADYESFMIRLPEQAFWLPILQRARAYMLAHLGQPVNVDELTQAALKTTVPQTEVQG